MADDDKIRTPDYDPENPRCDQEQLEFLKECVAEGPEGIEKWNDWYQDQVVEIWLQQADLIRIPLKGAYLYRAHLEGAKLQCTHLEGAKLWSAHLEDTYLSEANLEEATLWQAHLEGAQLVDTNLKGADFSRAIVDGGTLIWACEVDRNTKFEAVGLDSMRIYPATKQLLEYNIRRMNWESWYEYKDWDKFKPKEKRGWLSIIVRQPVKWFWAISDYGLRTWRIIAWFFSLAVIFAIAYRFWPDCVLVNGKVGDIRGFVHALYFSVVTMTTLGFGDIAANPDSWQGQVILMVQVILGYVLLGALVTRFAVLFTAGGPAGKFEKKERRNKTPK